MSLGIKVHITKILNMSKKGIKVWVVYKNFGKVRKKHILHKWLVRALAKGRRMQYSPFTPYWYYSFAKTNRCYIKDRRKKMRKIDAVWRKRK